LILAFLGDASLRQLCLFDFGLNLFFSLYRQKYIAVWDYMAYLDLLAPVFWLQLMVAKSPYKNAVDGLTINVAFFLEV